MSDARRRLENAALVTALLLVAAFVASALFGVLHRPKEDVVVEAPGRPLPLPPGKALGRIEVLNGTGRSGLARAASEQLRAAGYDVVYFGSRGSDVLTSVVIDRVGKPAIASGAAKALSIASVKTDRDSTLLLDATVIVGADWQKRKIEQEKAETGWKARLRKWLPH
jgi:hypothetical protein